MTLSHEGYIKRTRLDEYRKQRRGGKGIRGTESKEGDFVEHLLVANTHDWLLFFTDRGRVYKEMVYSMPGHGPLRQGPGAGQLPAARGGGDASRTCSTSASSRTSEPSSSSRARAGSSARSCREYQNIHRGGIIAMQLLEDDALIGTRARRRRRGDRPRRRPRARPIRFPVDQARAMGRTASGVSGIKLQAGDHVVGMALVGRRGLALLTRVRARLRQAHARSPTTARRGAAARGCATSPRRA